VAAFGVCFGALSPAAHATGRNWTPDGPVSAISVVGSTAYLGGQFTYIGPENGAGVPVSAASGTPASTWPAIVGRVDAVADDGAGGWFVGGLFDAVGSSAIRNLVHIRSDGTPDLLWDPSPDLEVVTLSRVGSLLYVGGTFRNIGGQVRSGLAAIDATTGSATAWSPDAGPDAGIASVLATATVVYVGGSFTSVSGVARRDLVAVDPDGSIAAWDPSPDGGVSAIAMAGQSVIIGGWFTHVGGVSRSHLAAVDVSTGEATGWDPNVDGSVGELAVAGQTVYASGPFHHVGLVARDWVAAIDAVDATAMAWAPQPDSPVYAIAVSGSVVYLGGSFRRLAGVPRRALAAVDATTGVAAGWAPATDGSPLVIAPSGGDLFVGGLFTSVGGVYRQSLAAIDLGSGVATSWAPVTDGGVNALLAAGSTVYVGGAFGQVDGVARTELAAVNATTGAVTDWAPVVASTRPQDVLPYVLALGSAGGTLYVGGAFGAIDGAPRQNVAAFDLASGQLAAWDPSADAPVSSILAGGGSIYVGGRFANVGGQPRTALAALDPLTGVATPFDAAIVPDPHFQWDVSGLALSGSTLYVAGGFSNIGGQPRMTVGSVDAASGAVTAWAPTVTVGGVAAVAVDGSTVYLGGSLGLVGGQTHFAVAAVDSRSGLPGAFAPVVQPSAEVRALVVTDHGILFGGASVLSDPRELSRLGIIEATAPTTPPPPTISGPAIIGGTLVGRDGRWDGIPLASTTRVWQRCDSSGSACVDLPENGLTYAIVPTDEGFTFRLRVTYTNRLGSGSAASDPTPTVVGIPAPIDAPAISGTAGVGATLAVSDGVWTDAPRVDHSWLRCSATGDGCVPTGTGSTYAVTILDIDHRLRVSTTATNAAGTTSNLTPLTELVPAPPASVKDPTVGGPSVVGASLTGIDGGWIGPVQVTYRWLRCDASGGHCLPTAATTTAYAIHTIDVGSTLRFAVTATNPSGQLARLSKPTAVVIAGPFPVQEPRILAPGRVSAGALLRVTPGAWLAATHITFTYTWYVGSHRVAGATRRSYRIQPRDQGHPIRCRVTAVAAGRSVTRFTNTIRVSKR
jgi:hypothetical protein